MQFLKDIREHHLKDFESSALDEIHKFMEFLEKRYAPPTDAVPGPNPEPVGVETTPMPLIPDPEPINEAPVTPTPVVADPAPVDTAEPITDTQNEPVAASEVVVEATEASAIVTTTEVSMIDSVAPSAFTCQPSEGSNV